MEQGEEASLKKPKSPVLKLPKSGSNCSGSGLELQVVAVCWWGNRSKDCLANRSGNSSLAIVVSPKSESQKTKK